MHYDISFWLHIDCGLKTAVRSNDRIKISSQNEGEIQQILFIERFIQSDPDKREIDGSKAA